MNIYSTARLLHLDNCSYCDLVFIMLLWNNSVLYTLLKIKYDQVCRAKISRFFFFFFY